MRSRRGVALIIVLLTLFTLGVMAGIFSYAMKVETRLAANTTSGTELEWLGRSGVEVAKWILVQQETQVPSERGYNALNQFWAGGPGPVDSVDNPFAGMSLNQIPVGEGIVSLEIVDQERWMNINSVYRNPALMDQALSMAGADATDASVISAAILDWVDRDDIPQAANGAERDYYLSLPQPIEAKNGVIDDLRELLQVRGVTPAIFWGPSWTISVMGGGDVAAALTAGGDDLAAGAGLSELFCAVSTGRINVNTAPEPVLRLLLGGNASRAREVVRMREELPARDAGDMARLLGGVGPGAGTIGGQLTVQSFTFAVRVTAQLGAARETFLALISRAGSREYQTLLFRRE
ncbi:MAG: general secretion pathway protein GspK [Verrucomicrobiae bacterium]|nr:general secretion pathway protein GspK [Verrucomicrobiae bacterium]